MSPESIATALTGVLLLHAATDAILGCLLLWSPHLLLVPSSDRPTRGERLHWADAVSQARGLGLIRLASAGQAFIVLVIALRDLSGWHAPAAVALLLALYNGGEALRTLRHPPRLAHPMVGPVFRGLMAALLACAGAVAGAQL